MSQLNLPHGNQQLKSGKQKNLGTYAPTETQQNLGN